MIRHVQWVWPRDVANGYIQAGMHAVQVILFPCFILNQT